MIELVPAVGLQIQGESMTEYISNNLTTIILAIVALFAVGIAIRIVVRKKRINSNIVNQSNNFVGGDQAGRDINKK